MKNETNFRSRYTKRVECPTITGRPLHNNYQIRINEKGHKTLYKIGEHNLQAEIQAGTEENEISTILERYKGGDKDALNKAQAGYVDLTKCPKDLREAQDSILKLKNEFKTLPIDIRRQFDMSPEKYIHDYGTEKWIKIMIPKKEEKQFTPAPHAEDKKEEVKTE